MFCCLELITSVSSGERLTCFCRVGGAIGENNFKFFIQFTGYTALYCIHVLVVMAIYVAKQKQAEVCWTPPNLRVIKHHRVTFIPQLDPYQLTVHYLERNSEPSLCCGSWTVRPLSAIPSLSNVVLLGLLSSACLLLE
jgi:hypothetical protein